MADVVISEFMDEKIVAESFKGFDVLYDPSLVSRREELLVSVSNARALIVRNMTQVDETLLKAAKKLQVIGRLGVGMDNIDLQECDLRKVKVCPAVGANDLAVAEYVMTAAMFLLRRAFFSTDRIVKGQWPRSELIGCEVSGKQLGLIGFGAIARETATRANALGMKVAAYDPYLSIDDPSWSMATPMDLSSLLNSSDIVSLHIPLTDKTHHLIDASMIAQMRSNAILINAARGGVIDENALVNALKNQQVAGAVLDVFENEPLNEVNGKLFENIPNLIMTPHIAGVTEESNFRVSQVTAKNVLSHIH